MADEIQGVICLTDYGIYATPKIGEFVVTTEFANMHIYRGKSFPMEEFNKISDKVIDEAIMMELRPHVRLVKVAPEPAKKKAAKKKAAKKKEDK